VPQQQNDYDCGLFVLYYMQRFIQEAPERFRKKDYSMVSQHCAVSLFLFADRYDMDDGCVSHFCHYSFSVSLANGGSDLKSHLSLETKFAT
jgi:hypothetical protein